MRPAQEGIAGQLRSWATRARPVIDCEAGAAVRLQEKKEREQAEGGGCGASAGEGGEREQAMTEAAQGERRVDS